MSYGGRELERHCLVTDGEAGHQRIQQISDELLRVQQTDVLRGTLDLLIMRTIALEPRSLKPSLL